METDSSGTVTAVNVFAPDGLVARKKSGTWAYDQFDPQGSVSQRTNSSGTVTSSSMYDAYGKHVNIPGPTTDVYAWNGRWGYYYDSETGLYSCQQRYYDANQGRWLNRDPIGYGGGANLYGYCGSGPVGGVDPEGLEVAWWQFEFSGGAWGSGLSTGFRNVGEGLIDLVHTGVEPLLLPTELLLGQPEYNPLRNSTIGEPGGSESRWLANFGLNCATAAAGNPRVVTWKVENGLGGTSLLIDGRSVIRAEIQEWKRGQPGWKYSHWHTPEGGGLHYPWEWKGWKWRGWPWRWRK